MLKRIGLPTLLTVALVTAATWLPPAQADGEMPHDSGAIRRSPDLAMLSLDLRLAEAPTVCFDLSECPALDALRPGADPSLEQEIAAMPRLEYLDLFRLSLRAALAAPEFDTLQVGLMTSHRLAPGPGSTCRGNLADAGPIDCSNGAVILRGYRGLGEPGSRSELDCILQALRRLSFGSGPQCPGPPLRSAAVESALPAIDHPWQGAALYFELYRYLRGGAIATGHYGALDYETPGSPPEAGGDDPRSNLHPDYCPACWDPRIERGGTHYRSPLDAAGECSRLLGLHFLFGASSDTHAPRDLIRAPANSGGLDLARDGDLTRQLVESLYGRDLAPGLPGRQNLVSHFFVPHDRAEIAAAIAPYAAASNTALQDLSREPTALIEGLRAVLRHPAAAGHHIAHRVLAATPHRTGSQDALYLSLFEVGQGPAWPGNLKKLQLIHTASGEPRVVDALGEPALDPGGGLRSEALSLWTDIAGSLLDDADPDRRIVADRDGGAVTRGGAGQKIPGVRENRTSARNSDGLRQLFYLSGHRLAALDATTELAADPGLQAQLGTSGQPARTLDLLQFARGGAIGTERPRPWLMGDLPHSRPVHLAYATATGPAAYLAVGSNGGFLHFIRDRDPDGRESGEEAWAFAPPEGLAVQSVLANVTGLHPHAVDGSPVVSHQDRNGNGLIDAGEEALLVLGLRRGGSAYYALDIGDPRQPQLRWRVHPGLPDYAELGLSFSTPRPGVLRVGGRATAVLFIGGGYDPAKDRPGRGHPDQRGRALFVIDAATGHLVWKAVPGSPTGPDPIDPRIFRHAALQDSVPSDLTVVDSDGDGLSDRLLVGDTGGRVWRADFSHRDADGDGEVRDGWLLSVLARLGRDRGPGTSHDRRFFHEPDLVRGQDAQGPYDGVLIGSGNREDPLDRGGRVHDHVYLIKDRHPAIRIWSGERAAGHSFDSDLDHDALPDVDASCAPPASADCPGLSGRTRGWRLPLGDGTRIGEKSLSPPLSHAGRVHFTTYVPPQPGTDCAPAAGSGRQYVVKLDDGMAAFPHWDGDENRGAEDRSRPLAGAGIPGAPVFVIGPGGRHHLLQPDLRLMPLPGTGRLRRYWYRQDQ